MRRREIWQTSVLKETEEGGISTQEERFVLDKKKNAFTKTGRGRNAVLGRKGIFKMYLNARFSVKMGTRSSAERKGEKLEKTGGSLE